MNRKWGDICAVTARRRARAACLLRLSPVLRLALHGIGPHRCAAPGRPPWLRCTATAGSVTPGRRAASSAHPVRKSAAPGMMSWRKRRAASARRALTGDGPGRTTASPAVSASATQPPKRIRSSELSARSGMGSRPRATRKLPNVKKRAETSRPSTTGPASSVSRQKTSRATKKSEAATANWPRSMATPWGSVTHPCGQRRIEDEPEHQGRRRQEDQQAVQGDLQRQTRLVGRAAARGWPPSAKATWKAMKSRNAGRGKHEHVAPQLGARRQRLAERRQQGADPAIRSHVVRPPGAEAIRAPRQAAEAASGASTITRSPADGAPRRERQERDQGRDAARHRPAGRPASSTRRRASPGENAPASSADLAGRRAAGLGGAHLAPAVSGLSGPGGGAHAIATGWRGCACRRP